MVGQTLASQGVHERNDAALLLGQGSGVPVHQIPRRGHDPRSRDEVHRRGHGCGRDLRRGVREVAAGGRRELPSSGKVFISVRNADKPRVVEIARALRNSVSSLYATRGTAAYLSEARDRGGAGEQGRRRPPAHRRHDQERRDRHDHQHHRRAPFLGPGFLLDSSLGAAGADHVLHDAWPERARHAQACSTCGSCARTRCSPCTGCSARRLGLRNLTHCALIAALLASRSGVAQIRTIEPGDSRMRKIPLTAAGAEMMRTELHQLKTVERPRVIQAIQEARSHGDLSENAEYDAAKERQSFIEGRIAELETQARQRAGDRPEPRRHATAAACSARPWSWRTSTAERW